MEKEYFDELSLLISEKKFKQLKDVLDEHNEVDTADFISEIDPKDAVIVFRVLSKETAADVFAYLDSDIQQIIISSITDSELSEIVDELFVDEVVDMLEELPANVVKRVLRMVDPQRRKIINQFLKYPDNSAGSIMSWEMVNVKKQQSVGEAIKRIRQSGIDNETIYTCYVTNEHRVLEGTVAVKDLLLATDDEIIDDLMNTDIISVNTLEDTEQAAALFAKYDLLSIPVTDKENRLVGVITVDDAVEVIQAEATEDFEKMAAMRPSEKPYLKTKVITHAKNRIVWLLILMVSATISGSILSKFQTAFAAVPLLVTFMPMLTDTGGNAGSQTSTMIIRGMALTEIKFTDFFKVWFKEIRVSLLVGACLCVVNFARILIMYPGNVTIAIVVSISLMITVIMATSLATFLPMIAKKLGADPALMASPLLTTIVDALSLLMYFSLAQMVLHI